MDLKKYFNKVLSVSNEVFYYHEELNTIDDYFYDILTTCDNRSTKVVIRSEGVILDHWHDGTFLITNISPRRLFGPQESLTDTQLIKVMSILAATKGEGKTYNKEDFNKQLFNKGKS
jgi:hypothetical protein